MNRRPWSAIVGVIALVIVGCTGEPEPREELAAAVAATEATSVNFRLTAVADRGALDSLEGGAADAAAFLDQAGLVGARDPDGALRLAVTLGADEPLLEVVSLPEGTLLLRTGLGSLLGVGRTDPSDALDPALAELGVDETGRRALAVSFAGGWLELTDVGDVDAALADLFADPQGDAVALGDLSGLLDAITVVEARDAGDVRRFDVTFDPGAVTGSAGGAPLPGTVVLRDGRLQEVRLELPAADGEPAAGVVEVVVTITEVDDGIAVLRPEPDAAISATQLLDLVERLQAAGLTPTG